MTATETVTTETAPRRTYFYRHSLVVRITHWINVLAVLIMVSAYLTQRGISSRSRQAGATQVPFYTLEVAQTAADWKKAKADLAIDRRLLLVGLVLLILFIVLHVIFTTLAIAIGATTIVIAVLLERKKHPGKIPRREENAAAPGAQGILLRPLFA